MYAPTTTIAANPVIRRHICILHFKQNKIIDNYHQNYDPILVTIFNILESHENMKKI